MIRRLRLFNGISVIAWTGVTFFGELFNGAPNAACYPYLGCDAGFFGYDALEHFLFGFAALWMLVWLCGRFSRISILHIEFWKSALLLVAMVAFFSVLWEIGEWFRDAYLLDIAHETLLNFRLHINYLAQPSNFDTMGDLSFSLLGSLCTLPILRYFWFSLAE